METQTPPNDNPAKDHHTTVDTSRPFASVKEAVAIFGEKLLTGELYSSPNPFATPARQNTTPWKFSPVKNQGSDEETIGETLKRLESELEETKTELKLLKERESDTEVALASLNAELHKNMSKMARAEADTAAKAAAVAATRTDSVKVREEEMRKRDMIVRMDDTQTLAQILSIGDEEGLFGGRERERKMMMMKMKKKKKPIIPLLGDLFSRKKGSSSASLHSSLFSSTHVYLN